MLIVRRSALAGLALAAVAPAIASAQPLTPLGVFADATLFVKLVMLGLLAATLAALVVCGRKLAQGPRLAGGSAYLSGLRLGGPLAGLMGAAYGALNMSIGLSNTPTPVPIQVLAHGAAEVIALILLGLASGSAAVIANWAVEARIDRTVLTA